MYSILFGTYFYEKDIIEMINKIESKRKEMRLKGETMKTTFAEDLKSILISNKI